MKSEKTLNEMRLEGLTQIYAIGALRVYKIETRGENALQPEDKTSVNTENTPNCLDISEHQSRL